MAGSQGGFGAGIDSAGIDAMVEQIQADERLEYTKQRQQEAEERVQMQSILAREMAMQAQEPLVVVEAEASSLLEHDASTSCRPAVDEFPLLSRCACQHRLDVSNEINLKSWPLRISVAGGLFVCFVLFCGRGLICDAPSAVSRARLLVRPPVRTAPSPQRNQRTRTKRRRRKRQRRKRHPSGAPKGRHV